VIGKVKLFEEKDDQITSDEPHAIGLPVQCVDAAEFNILDMNLAPICFKYETLT
jgi:hypothetical protein